MLDPLSSTPDWTPSTLFLDVAGGRIAYDVSGPRSARLIVCMHGMGDTRRSYRFLAPRLVRAGYRVATMDVRGHGDSSIGWPRYSEIPAASDGVALIRELGGPAVLIGHSGTGRTAVWAAAEHPDDVSGMVLIDSFVRDTRPNLIARLAAEIVGRSATLWARYYASLYPTRKPADFDDYLSALKRKMRDRERLIAMRGLLTQPPEENRDRLAEVRCPALVIMGGRDGDFRDPAAEAQLIASGLRAERSVALIADAGHYPHAEFPDETAAAVIRFLAES